MKFLVIDGELLANETFKPTDKLILSYMYNLEKGGKKFFGGEHFIGKELGLKTEFIKKRMNQLNNWGLIQASESCIILSKSWEYIVNFTDQVDISKAFEEIANKMSTKFGAV